jgi:methyl-accepting chemotaxis protein
MMDQGRELISEEEQAEEKKLGIAKRLALGLGLIVALMVVVAGSGYWGLNVTHATVRSILDDSTLGEDSLRARVAILDLRRFEKDYQLNMGDKSKQASYLEKWTKAHEDLTAQLDEMEKHSLSAADKALVQTMRVELANYVVDFNNMKTKIDTGELRTPQASNIYITKYKDSIHQMEDSSGAFATENIERMHGKGDYVSGVEKKTLSSLRIGLIAAVALSLVVTGLSRSIVRPLWTAMEVANRVATGNLAHEVDVDRKDEIGKLLRSNKTMVESLRGMAKVAECIVAGELTVNVKPQSDKDILGNAFAAMTIRLRQIISEVREAANIVASGPSQVNASAQQLSSGTSEQAASVEETTSSLEQMNASIIQNTENSRQTEQMALKAITDAEQSGVAVKEIVEAINAIANKISIIEEITYQTNLLALNAAIEAAHAGEHGKGFAVVATEVRKLAERSQTAAQEISGLVGSSVKVSERSGSLLTELVPTIKKTTELVQEVSAASTEQSSGVGQINRAMSQVDQITQQNASAAEELASTAEEMASQAESLQQLMDFFKLGEYEEARSQRQQTLKAKFAATHRGTTTPTTPGPGSPRAGQVASEGSPSPSENKANGFGKTNGSGKPAAEPALRDREFVQF